MKKSTNSGFRSFVLLAAFLIISPGIFAQTNFSGTWAFNESKSKLGEGPGGPGGPMGGGAMTVAQDASILSVEQTMRGPDGDTKMTSKYNLNGTVSENTFIMDMKRKSTLTWAPDKKSFTIVSTMVFDMGGDTREMKTTETWKLSDDGKTLFIDQTRPGGPDGGGERNMTMAYDKK
jgi:hypothetical protein